MTVKGLLVEISEPEWRRILRVLVQENGISIMITWVSRRELGFSCRYKDRDSVYLDFFDEPSLTAFLLRWA